MWCRRPSLLQAEEFHRLLCAFLSHLSELEKSAKDGTPLEEEEEEEEAMAEAQSQLKVGGGAGRARCSSLEGSNARAFSLHPPLWSGEAGPTGRC